MTELHFVEDRIDIFPTQVFKRKFHGLDQVNDRLRRLVLERERTDPGIKRSNVGSWHSATDFTEWADPAVEVVTNLVQGLVHDYVAATLSKPPGSFQTGMQLEGWAMVMRAGGYARPHFHPSCNFAVVYYVDVGDETKPGDLSGVLEMLDPRHRPQMVLTPGIDPRDSVCSSPLGGQMILFPAWVVHHVHVYRGTAPRISLAFNVTVRELRELGDPPNGGP